MSTFDRIKTVITHLPPKSALTVFQFINDLFESDLDPILFESKFWDFNAGEQHCICTYLKFYFTDSKRYTFFYKWMEEMRLEYEGIGEEAVFYTLTEALTKNKEKLGGILNSYKKTAERRFKQLKKDKVPFKAYSDYYKEVEIDRKIPLFYEPMKFKAFFMEKMRSEMQVKQADAFFKNAFDYKNNIYTVKLLYIEIDNRTNIGKKMALVKKLYDEEYKGPTEKAIKDHYEKLKRLSDREKLSYRKIKYKELPTTHDFAKIMYNAFPHIRENKTEKDVDVILNNAVSNTFRHK